MKARNKPVMAIAIIGGLIVMLIMVAGTFLTGQKARNDTEDAVRTVSLLYMDELAERRAQVVEGNLEGRITDLQSALGLMTTEDLSDLFLQVRNVISVTLLPEFAEAVEVLPDL